MLFEDDAFPEPLGLSVEFAFFSRLAFYVFTLLHDSDKRRKRRLSLIALDRENKLVQDPPPALPHRCKKSQAAYVKAALKVSPRVSGYLLE